MATKKITFDPEAGVAYAANFIMLGGANFEGNFEVVGTSNTAFTSCCWILGLVHLK